MATITGATVVDQQGSPIEADCHGNNAAILCPRCRARALLLIARPAQRGSGPAKPVPCPNRDCKTEVWLTIAVGTGTFNRVTVHVR